MGPRLLCSPGPASNASSPASAGGVAAAFRSSGRPAAGPPLDGDAAHREYCGPRRIPRRTSGRNPADNPFARVRPAPPAAGRQGARRSTCRRRQLPQRRARGEPGEGWAAPAGWTRWRTCEAQGGPLIFRCAAPQPQPSVGRWHFLPVPGRGCGLRRWRKRTLRRPAPPPTGWWAAAPCPSPPPGRACNPCALAASCSRDPAAGARRRAARSFSAVPRRRRSRVAAAQGAVGC